MNAMQKQAVAELKAARKALDAARAAVTGTLGGLDTALDARDREWQAVHACMALGIDPRSV